MRIALRATLGAVAATTAGHTAGALCGAGTGNQELKSTSYEGLTRRDIFQLVRSKPEIDHKLSKGAKASLLQKRPEYRRARHFYNSGYLGLATLTAIKRLKKSRFQRPLASETTFR
jgi:hypothetical protein